MVVRQLSGSLNKFFTVLWRNGAALIGFVLFAVIIGFGVWQVLAPRKDWRLEAIRKSGYPLTLPDLDAWYPAVPDNENAALIYTNAFALLTAADTRNAVSNLLGDISLPQRGQSISPEDRIRLVSLLASNEASLRLFRSASELTRARYPIDLRNGAATLLPDLSRAKSAVMTLTAQAYLQSVEGNSQEATESLAAAARVADSFASEPIVVSSLVRIDCWNIIVGRMELVLNNTLLTDDQLTRLEKLLAEAEQPHALARSLAGQRCMALALSNNPMPPSSLQPQQVTTTPNWTRIRSGLVRFTGLPRRDQAFFLGVMATNIAAAELPYSERFQASKSAAARILTQPNRFYILSRAFLPPGLASIHEKDAEHTARVRVARTALAVERYRRSHGNAAPESLGQAVPDFLKEILKDPIDGQGIRYKKIGSGYVIYSIGLDEKEDGGTEFDANDTKPDDDITFFLAR